MVENEVSKIKQVIEAEVTKIQMVMETQMAKQISDLQNTLATKIRPDMSMGSKMDYVSTKIDALG